MKASILTTLVAFFCTLFSSAQDLLISGSGSENTNGVYVQTGMYKNFPLYENVDNSNYQIRFNYRSENGCQTNGRWHIVNMQFGVVLYTSIERAISGELPVGLSWDACQYGTEPVPQVGYNSPYVTFGSVTLHETKSNNGTIGEGQMLIQHNGIKGESFTYLEGEDLVSSGKITIENLPEGIVAEAYGIDTLTLEVSFSGQASSHTNGDDADLIIHLENELLSYGDTTKTQNLSDSLSSINFFESYEVGCGDDLKAILESSGAYDEFHLTCPVYTASDITINHPISIIGNGPEETIIQAHEEYDQASGRVFFLDHDAPDTTYLEGITVRHGRVEHATVANGAGILSRGPLKVLYCSIVKNKTVGTQNATQTRGAGLVAGGGLIMLNSFISENHASGISSLGYDALGAGMEISRDSWLENVTVSGNISNGPSAGIHYFNGTHHVIHCTITKNVSEKPTEGTGVYMHTGVPIIYFENTILAGNIGGTSDFHNQQGKNTNFKNCIIGDTSSYANEGAFQGDTSGLIFGDPMVNELADNGGVTLTHSLQPNSPAIDGGFATDVELDQRGYLRDNMPDIGAYENGALPYISFNSGYANSSRPELTGEVFYGAEMVSIIVGGNNFVFAQTDGNEWIVQEGVIGTLADGTYPVSVSVNDGSASNTVQGEIVVDTKAPEFQLFIEITSPTSLSEVDVFGQFEESIMGLEEGDIKVTNGELVAFDFSNDVLSLGILNDDAGVVTVEIAEGAFTDLAGNLNNMSTVSYEYGPLAVYNTNEVEDLYPNPTTGEVRLSTTAELIQVYSLEGILVLEFQNNEVIDLGSLGQGMFIVEYQLGNQRYRQRVIKN